MAFQKMERGGDVRLPKTISRVMGIKNFYGYWEDESETLNIPAIREDTMTELMELFKVENPQVEGELMFGDGVFRFTKKGNPF